MLKAQKLRHWVGRGQIQLKASEKYVQVLGCAPIPPKQRVELIQGNLIVRTQKELGFNQLMPMEFFVTSHVVPAQYWLGGAELEFGEGVEGAGFQDIQAQYFDPFKPINQLVARIGDIDLIGGANDEESFAERLELYKMLGVDPSVIGTVLGHYSTTMQMTAPTTTGANMKGHSGWDVKYQIKHKVTTIAPTYLVFGIRYKESGEQYTGEDVMQLPGASGVDDLVNDWDFNTEQLFQAPLQGYTRRTLWSEQDYSRNGVHLLKNVDCDVYHKANVTIGYDMLDMDNLHSTEFGNKDTKVNNNNPEVPGEDEPGKETTS